MGFERLEEVVEIEVEYTARSCLAVGAGRETSLEATESPVVKIGNQPVIPGSTLKGVIRSTLESLLAQDNIKVCVPQASIPGSIRRSEHSDYVQKIGRQMPCGVKNPCPICQIFGTTGDREGLSGRAIFLDAQPIGEVGLIERTHVALTRDTKSQASGKLMSLQAVDAGAKFKGEIRLINPKRWQIGAILEALETVKMLGIGSKKTAGYGDVEIEILSLKAKRFKDGSWQEPHEESQKDYKEAFIQAIPTL